MQVAVVACGMQLISDVVLEELERNSDPEEDPQSHRVTSFSGTLQLFFSYTYNSAG